jgi:glyoxalase family protein
LAGDEPREITVFTTAGGGPGAEVHLEERPDLPRGRAGRGGVHHVAFRTPNETEHERWHDHLKDNGISVTPVIDRFYFKSIYFHEPGGALFEIATDEPGFTADEPLEHLGEHLSLPPFLEPRRAAIEANLKPLPRETNTDARSKEVSAGSEQ